MKKFTKYSYGQSVRFNTPCNHHITHNTAYHIKGNKQIIKIEDTRYEL